MSAALVDYFLAGFGKQFPECAQFPCRANSCAAQCLGAGGPHGVVQHRIGFGSPVQLGTWPSGTLRDHVWWSHF